MTTITDGNGNQRNYIYLEIQDVINKDKVSAMKCYVKNGYLYTADQIVSNRYIGNFLMRRWKFILGMWYFFFVNGIAFVPTKDYWADYNK